MPAAGTGGRSTKCRRKSCVGRSISPNNKVGEPRIVARFPQGTVEIGPLKREREPEPTEPAAARGAGPPASRPRSLGGRVTSFPLDDRARNFPRTPMKTAQPFDFTPTQHQLLAAQDFERRAPGTILRDFEALLGLIGDAGLPVPPAHPFAMSSLETIDRRLAQPLELRLKRALQKSYPPINGLYLVLRATGLGRIDTSLKHPRLQLDPFVLASWRSLNAAERYFALLRAWWGRASEEMIGERRGGWGETVLRKTLSFFQHFPKTGILAIQTPQDADLLRYYPGFYNLALLELFGLFEIRA